LARSRVVQTPRGWGLLAGALVALTVGFLALNPLLLLVGVVALAFVGADLLAFAYATRDFGADHFALQRTENSTLVPAGGIGTMAVRLESHRPTGFYAEIYDRVPEGLVPVAGSPHLLTWWAPGATQELAYAYRGELRGVHEVGPTVVLAHDTFGLAFRVARLDDRWPVEVVPQAALWKTEITERLRRETVGRVLGGPRGRGSEFRSLREYQQSDDFRTIVWKRSTFERLLVKESQAENRIDVALLLDVTAPMGEGRSGAEALDLAVEASLLIARYAFGEGDRIAVLLYGEGPVRFLPLDRTADHGFQVDRILGSAEVQPGLFRLEDAAQYLAQELHAPCSVFAFTALEPPPTFDRGGLTQLRKAGHRLFAFVPDPLALFPAPVDPLDCTALRLVGAPEAARRRTAIEQLRGAGGTVTPYGRSDLIDAVTARYVRLRMGAGGP
jgi:uncharacterized protein (DUF58 family)